MSPSDSTEHWLTHTVTPATRFSTYARWEGRTRPELEDFYNFYRDALSAVGAEWTVVTDYYNEDRRLGAVEVDFSMTLAQVFAWPTEFEIDEIADAVAIDLDVERDRDKVGAISAHIYELRRAHWLDRIRESPPARAVEYLIFSWSHGYMGRADLADLREALSGSIEPATLVPLLEADSRALRLFAQTLLERPSRRR